MTIARRRAVSLPFASERRIGPFSRARMLRAIGVGMLALVCLAVAGTASATAATTADLRIHSFAPLGRFSQAQNAECEASLAGLRVLCDEYVVTATNSSDAASEGPIVLTDVLPAGLTVVGEEFLLVRAVPASDNANTVRNEHLEGDCGQVSVTVTCSYPEPLEPDGALELRLFVTVSAETEGELNRVSVSGPDTPEASASEAMLVGPGASLFGANALVSYIASGDGAPDTIAGDHPYGLSTRL